MKQYLENGHLTLVGKAWEIRHQLKLLSKAGAKSNAAQSPTLREWLQASVRAR
ncbi:Z-ring formation inhibitor MciZ [Paenibacillus sp. MWE-103]|uniref:Z-ring formation inhibitor MciZ n=1 Tax=Paenibacillus artemisiicola TaxID=1172618 RepID=A0ABS3W6S9_9BACL|nr:Z-ring formation inhibitor MciZ [Paenibacillus artemisiicola]MBO7744016.1 Z-ring formation inhibitor MciZ [Paenibacillus artemisiicola]